MYEPKFKINDVIKPTKGESVYGFGINILDIIRIKNIKRINTTLYYTIYGNEYFTNNGIEDPLMSAKDIDKYYELDHVYLRKQKLNNIIYKSKIEVNE